MRLAPDLRARVEAAVKHPIILLDTLDGDPDFEPDVDAELEEDRDESEERAWQARPGAWAAR